MVSGTSTGKSVCGSLSYQPLLDEISNDKDATRLNDILELVNSLALGRAVLNT